MLLRNALVPVALLTAAYVASPGVAVWRLGSALQRGDAQALRELIDWPAVRAGLKEDISEGLVGMHEAEPAATARTIASDTLPPFGASFVAGIAGSVVDHEVTPEHLVAMLRQLPPPDALDPKSEAGGIRRAWFDGPTRFVIEIGCPGQEAGDDPLRLELALAGDGWKVVRAWVPQDLMDEANSRT